MRELCGHCAGIVRALWGHCAGTVSYSHHAPMTHMRVLPNTNFVSSSDFPSSLLLACLGICIMKFLNNCHACSVRVGCALVRTHMAHALKTLASVVGLLLMEEILHHFQTHFAFVGRTQMTPPRAPPDLILTISFFGAGAQ